MPESAPPPSFQPQRAIRRLRVRHFELLAILDREPTVRAAARRLSLTQPAVSKMLREIELSLGTALFLRSPRGLSATPAGTHLIAHSKAALNELVASAEDALQIGAGEGLTLRLGTFSVLPRVPAAIARVRLHYPSVRFRVRESTGVNLLRALVDGELDCVVGALPPEILREDIVQRLRVEVLAEDEICVMASRRHPLAGKTAITWRQLASCQWALPPAESLLRRGLIERILAAGLGAPVPVVEMLSPISLADLLSADGVLVGPLRREHAELEIANRRLVRLPLRPVAPLPPLAIITPERASPRAPMIAELRDALREHAVPARRSKPR